MSSSSTSHSTPPSASPDHAATSLRPADSSATYSPLPSTDATARLRRPTLIGEKRNLTCATCFKDARDLTGTNSKLKLCVRCKNVAYCSRECQVRDWSTHKSSCETPALQTSKGIDLDQRLELWKDLHHTSIAQATYSAMCYSQPTDNIAGFDIDTHCMWFRISPRDDHGGNPAKMFRIDGGKIRSRRWMLEAKNFDDPIESHLQRTDEVVETGQVLSLEKGEGDGEGEEDEGDGRVEMSGCNQSGPNKQRMGVCDSLIASIPHHTAKYLDYLDLSMRDAFIGIIPICYSIIMPRGSNLNRIGLIRISHDRPLFYGAPEGVRVLDGSTIPPPRHEVWLERLQSRVELGHVFNPKRSVWSSMLKAGMGEIKRKSEGGKYSWAPLTKEESRRYGYQYIVCGLSY